VGFVTTSNFHPDGLYPNGLHRDRILPAIELLKKRLEVFERGQRHRLPPALARTDGHLHCREARTPMPSWPRLPPDLAEPWATGPLEMHIEARRSRRATARSAA
jgi:cell division protein ZapE